MYPQDSKNNGAVPASVKAVYLEPWHRLEVLSGAAVHVPDAVMGLLSDDPVTFDAAYWQIDNHVVVQGDLFSAAGVLPKYLGHIFLEARFKKRVFDLIWEIGAGFSDDDMLQRQYFDESVAAMRFLLANTEVTDSEYASMIRTGLHEIVDMRRAR